MKYFAWWALLAPVFCLTAAAASPVVSRHTNFRATLRALRTRALMLRSQTGTADLATGTTAHVTRRQRARLRWS